MRTRHMVHLSSVVLLAIWVSGVSLPVRAAPIVYPIVAHAAIDFREGWRPGGEGDPNNIVERETAFSLTGSVRLLSTFVRQTGTVGSGLVQASPGAFRALAFAQSDPMATPLYEVLVAAGNVRDILTISFPGVDLCPADSTDWCSLRLQASVDGWASWENTSLSGGPVGVGFGLYNSDASGFLARYDFPSGSPAPNGYFSVTRWLDGIIFQEDQPFNIWPFFGTAARLFPPPQSNSWAEGRFTSTMRFTGLEVLDPAGAMVTNYVTASASGAIYGPHGVADVPEPGTNLLIAAGLVVLGLAGRRLACPD